MKNEVFECNSLMDDVTNLIDRYLESNIKFTDKEIKSAIKNAHNFNFDLYASYKKELFLLTKAVIYDAHKGAIDSDYNIFKLLLNKDINGNIGALCASNAFTTIDNLKQFDLINDTFNRYFSYKKGINSMKYKFNKQNKPLALKVIIDECRDGLPEYNFQVDDKQVEVYAVMSKNSDGKYISSYDKVKFILGYQQLFSNNIVDITTGEVYKLYKTSYDRDLQDPVKFDTVAISYSFYIFSKGVRGDAKTEFKNMINIANDIVSNYNESNVKKMN